MRYLGLLAITRVVLYLLVTVMNNENGRVKALSVTQGEIYGIRNSGWTSPQWNWGYGVGTGHDCAAICRRKYQSTQARKDLVEGLLNPPADDPAARQPTNFEEVKLVLALTWQNGRWSGRDGGPGGYGEVLELMAAAKRYETGSPEECARALVSDMAARFHTLDPDPDQISLMEAISKEEDVDISRRRCSGLVLEAMGFIETGC